MSPLLQKRRPQQSNQRTSSQSPSSLPKTQHPHRAFGFSSIRQLARSSSGQTLRTLPTTSYQQPYSHGCSPPKDGELRRPGSSLPSDSKLQQSRGSSAESLPIDKSAISSDSTYATTPSPAKHRAFQLLESNSPVQQRKGMGNKGSRLRKNLSPLEGKQSSATDSTTDVDKTSGSSSNQKPSVGSQQPATFAARGSSAIVNVPRRRSSLTVLHLDSSHFETPDPQRQTADHRASTLSEPRRRPSVLVETIRPVTTIISSPIDTTSTVQPQQQRETLSPGFLSPPLLSPPLSHSPLSTASSQALSSKSRNSVVPAFIHLPKTFPDGPIPVPKPPLTVVHHHCYHSHKRVIFSRNKSNPVPCMTCGETDGEARWKCVWCLLRVCDACMAEFDAKERKLDVFLAAIEKRKEDKKDEGLEVSGGGGGKGEEIEAQKEDLSSSHKESQRLSTAAVKAKVSTTASK